MKPPIVSEAEAQKASRKSGTWKPGWYLSRIETAREYVSPSGNDCFELGHAVHNAAGDVRNVRDYLVAVESQLLKLKHAIEAVGGSEKYLAGQEISAEDFHGEVEVYLAIEKKDGFTRNVVRDYRRAAAVVNLRTVAKALVLLGTVSLAALTSACAPVPGPSMPVRYAQAPAYNYNPRPPYVPPSQLNQVPVAPSSSWQNSLGPMATGAAVGGIGGVMATRALSGAEAHAVDEAVAETVVEKEAAHAVEKSVATHTVDSVVVRGGLGAAALTGVEEAEALEFLELIFWLAL